MTPGSSPRVPLRTVAREWGRIGAIGFGGPPAHIALLRRLCVTERGWLPEEEFTDAIAATNLLPGPASTQLAIWCAWRLAGRWGAAVGGFCFIVPGLVVILGLSALFLESRPPVGVLGAAAGAGAVVPAVAVNAFLLLVPASWARAGGSVPGRWAGGSRVRWCVYLVAGGVGSALAGPWLVVVLVGCGLLEIAWRRPAAASTGSDARPDGGPDGGPGVGQGRRAVWLGAPQVAGAGAAGGWAALAWVALKVGALSFGGGFVIIPLMQHDAVHTYHWMTGTQFLSAVALGQITPGPVVQTVAVVGYAAAGVAGGLFAVVIAFAPSFAFVAGGGSHFGRLRSNRTAQAFLAGAGPAAVGAIAGAAVPLAASLQHLWQVGLLAASAVWLVALRRNIPVALLAAAIIGSAAALAGAPVSR